MRLLWLSLSLSLLLSAGCGAAAPRPTPPPPSTTVIAAPAPFASHGPLMLRSRSPEGQPPLYAELAADGAVTGTRCGATRFTDTGSLEREGAPLASPSDLGWHVDGPTLVTAAESQFTYADGTITPSDAELPAITVDPADAPASLVLTFFASLLVCDDVAP